MTVSTTDKVMCESFAQSQREVMRAWPAKEIDWYPCPNEAVGYTISDHGHVSYGCQKHLDELAGPPWHVTVYPLEDDRV